MRHPASRLLPDETLERWRWSTVETAKAELAKLERKPFSVLPAMALNVEFRR